MLPVGSINFIVTTVQLRAKGLSWMRLPFFVWAQFVTSFLLLLAFPPLEAAGVLQLMDRLAGTSFFMPSGLVVSGKLVLQLHRWEVEDHHGRIGDPDDRPPGNGLLLWFEVDDIDAAIARAEAMGAEVTML